MKIQLQWMKFMEIDNIGQYYIKMNIIQLTLKDMTMLGIVLDQQDLTQDTNKLITIRIFRYKFKNKGYDSRRKKFRNYSNINFR